jgi:periplasmic copper chaperone A
MRLLHFLALSITVFLVACGTPKAPHQSATPVAIAGSIEISEPRVRVPIEGRDQTAAYLTLTNRGQKADSLISASSTDAGKLELHAHIKTDEGMMAMREVKQIAVPAGATIPLSPGGFHIMVKQINDGLKTGDRLPIELTFASGAKASFKLQVVNNPSLEAAGKSGENNAKHQH